MIANIIDGEKIANVDYRTLISFLMRSIFMDFMESGRSGMKQGCENAVDTMVKFSEITREKNTGEAKSYTLKAADHTELVNELVFYATDGFVNRGADGIKGALVTMFPGVCDAMKEV